MLDVLDALLMIIGAVFLFLASLGLVRMPDVFLRLSLATKGATLGVGAVMIAAALHFNDLGVGVRTAATVIFVLMTAPVAAHMIGRAAYFDGAPLFENTQFDELCDRYDPATHALDSRPCAPSATTDSVFGDFVE